MRSQIFGALFGIICLFFLTSQLFLNVGQICMDLTTMSPKESFDLHWLTRVKWSSKQENRRDECFCQKHCLKIWIFVSPWKYIRRFLCVLIYLLRVKIMNEIMNETVRRGHFIFPRLSTESMSMVLHTHCTMISLLNWLIATPFLRCSVWNWFFVIYLSKYVS